MIKKIKIGNFKSLGPNTIVEFEKLIAFVGSNGSGKSNVIDVLKLFSDIMTLGLEGAITKRHGIKAIRRWSGGQPLKMTFEIEFQEKNYNATYSFAISSHKKHDYQVKYEKAEVKYRDGKTYKYSISEQNWIDSYSDLKPIVDPMNLALPIISGDSRFSDLAESLKKIQVYSIFPDVLRTPQKYDPTKPMTQHGINWTSILKDQNIETWKDELISALNKLTGEIDDIEIKQLSGYLLARFRHGIVGKSRKARWFDASQESDGTLRTAGIISALLQVPYLPVIAIEEPELTIHPGAIKLLFDFIKQANNNSQLIISTHSPVLLDLLEPENIRVVTKHEDFTMIKKLNPNDLTLVKSRLQTLGDIHRSKGLEAIQQEFNFN